MDPSPLALLRIRRKRKEGERGRRELNIISFLEPEIEKIPVTKLAG